MNTVLYTREFVRRAYKFLSSAELEKVRNMHNRLEHNAKLGDIIGPSWFREVRIKGKRAYFLVKEPYVVFIQLSDKKNQQAVIDSIREDAAAWLQIITLLAKNGGEDLLGRL